MSLRRWLAVELLVLGLAAPAAVAGGNPWVESGHWPSDYDHLFRKYTKRFFGVGFDWRWFKAQAIVESALRADARNHIGATGLMQIMPRTYQAILKHNPHFGSAQDPRWNIAAGIWYDSRLYGVKAWRKLEHGQRLLFTFAAYNAGVTGTLRAIKRTPPVVDAWRQVAPQAPLETRNYVANIVKVKTNATAPWRQKKLRPPKLPRYKGLTEKLRQ